MSPVKTRISNNGDLASMPRPQSAQIQFGRTRSAGNYEEALKQKLVNHAERNSLQRPYQGNV